MERAELDHYWMPFTANRRFKRAPRLLASAQGMYYRTPEGREVLDATSGLWCVNAGHGRREIADAVAEVLGELDYAPSFQMGHPAPFRLASRLAGILPPELDRVFFVNSGSEAVDSALKIALAYWRARGEDGRDVLVGRVRGYHGVGFGGISVGGIEANREVFPLLPRLEHLPHTWNGDEMAFSRGQPRWGAHLADDLERIVTVHGAGRVAAVIVEPVAGSTGVLVPPLGYLERLRELCDRHDVLLIFDEVITGFGRLGEPFASQRFGVVPDLLTLAKGLTNGTIPMGAVAVRRDVCETVLEAAGPGIELFHGYTGSGNPAACAAAQATLGLLEEEGLLRRARTLEEHFESVLHALRGEPNVADVRNLGLMGAVELAPGGAPGARGAEVMQDCFERGVLVRVTGDTVALSPPLVAEKEHLDQVAQTLRDTLRGVTR